ncbi:MAG: hypothetical protein ACOYT4_03345 [Nanoarchaeota archaeon]
MEKEADKSKNVEYHKADKITLRDIQDSIPVEFKTSERYMLIFWCIMIIVLVITFFQLPFAALFSGNLETIIRVGFPFEFFYFSIKEPNVMPFLIDGLVFNLITYFLLAYIFDIIINVFVRKYFSKNPVGEYSGQKKVSPKLYKIEKN